MLKLLGRLLVNALALWVFANLVPGFEFDSIIAIVITSIVMGVVNTFIKPILQLIALPITLVTFGIAAIVINVLLLWLISWVVPGFSIDGFLTALLSSIVLAFVSWFLHLLSKD